MKLIDNETLNSFIEKRFYGSNEEGYVTQQDRIFLLSHTLKDNFDRTVVSAIFLVSRNFVQIKYILDFLRGKNKHLVTDYRQTIHLVIDVAKSLWLAGQGESLPNYNISVLERFVEKLDLMYDNNKNVMTFEEFEEYFKKIEEKYKGEEK